MRGFVLQCIVPAGDGCKTGCIAVFRKAVNANIALDAAGRYAHFENGIFGMRGGIVLTPGVGSVFYVRSCTDFYIVDIKYLAGYARANKPVEAITAAENDSNRGKNSNSNYSTCLHYAHNVAAAGLV